MRVALQVVVMVLVYFIAKLLYGRRPDPGPPDGSYDSPQQVDATLAEKAKEEDAHSSSPVGVLLAVAVGLSLAGCVSTPVAQDGTAASVDPAIAIIVGPPVIEYRDVESDQPRPVPEADRARFVAILGASLESELRGKGLSSRPMTPEETGQLQLEETSGGLFEIARLRRQGTSPAAQHARDLVRRVFPGVLVLSVRSRFYQGPGAFWEPFTGGIRSSSERALFEGRLVYFEQDRVLWEQAVQVRESSDLSESTLKDMVQVLLSTIHSTSRGKGELK